MSNNGPIQPSPSSSTRDHKPPSRISSTYQISPPGWRLRGDAWWLLLSLVGKMQEPQKIHQPTGLVEPLSHSHFDPLEDPSRLLANSPGTFHGGLGTVQIIRYHSGPIGPYDELMIVPGDFNLPDELGVASALRITRIYVSTLRSVLNGRSNWNVPKHLARFEFKNDLETGKMRVDVYGLESYEFKKNINNGQITEDFQPTFSTVPFFSTIISPTFGSSLKIPMRMSLLPFVQTSLVQPPLAEGDLRMGMNETQHWKKFDVDVSGQVGWVAVEGGLMIDGRKRFGDGIRFPDFVPYKLGLSWTQASIDVREPVMLAPKPIT